MKHQRCKKKKIRKRSEILVVAPPHCRGHPHTFFPGVPLCLASILTKQFLCLLSHLLFYVSKNKLRTFIYNFCLLEKCIFFQGGLEPVELCFQPLASGGLVTRIPAFHPGHPGSIPGQETKILIQVTAHCCLSEVSRTIIHKTWELLAAAFPAGQRIQLPGERE